MFGDAMPQGWRGRHAVEPPKTLVSQFLTGACANGNDFPDFLVKSENRAGLVFWRQTPRNSGLPEEYTRHFVSQHP